MTLGENKFISTETYRASARLVTLSAAVILAKLLNIGGDGLELLGASIKTAQAEKAAFFATAFFVLSFVVHWHADYRSYANWFESNFSPINYVFDEKNASRTIAQDVKANLEKAF